MGRRSAGEDAEGGFLGRRKNVDKYRGMSGGWEQGREAGIRLLATLCAATMTRHASTVRKTVPLSESAHGFLQDVPFEN